MVVFKKNLEKERQKIIEKGLSFAENSKQSTEWTTICLRIPKKMVIDIDDAFKKELGLNRTSWILRALQKYLKEDEDE